MNSSEPHVTVHNLTMAYGSFVLMRDLTFTINKGDVFIIMGGSGCGKSTLMKILVGLKSPAKGKVLYFHCEKSSREWMNNTDSR